MKRSRALVVVIGLAIAGLVMLSWTQTWFTVHLDASSAVTSTVTADGSTAVPQYTALALASMALFLALTIAGPVLRIVLAAIQIVLGAFVAVTGVESIHDPVAASRNAIGQVAGVSDLAAVRGVVTSVNTSWWPYLGIVAGLLAMALGIVIMFVQRYWPGASRKYGGTGGRPKAELHRDASVDWDDLSGGIDPTSSSDPTGVETTRAESSGVAPARADAPGDSAEEEGGPAAAVSLNHRRRLDDQSSD